MAYTKAPTQNNHNVQRIPSIGTAFVVSDDSVDVPTTLNFIDCFARKEKQFGTDPHHNVWKRDAWIKANAVSGTGFTGTFSSSVVVTEETLPSVFFAHDQTFYRGAYTGIGTVTISALSTTSANAVTGTGTLAVNNSNTKKVCWLTGAGVLRTWNEDGTGGTVSGTLTATGYRNLVFLNGYLFAADSVGRIWNSAAGGVLTTWNSTDFLYAEMFPDGISWLAKHKNYLVAAGPQSIEFFFDNAIEVGSPLARQESYASKVGSYLTNYPGKRTAYINDDIYFIGQNHTNSSSLYRIRDFQVQEIPNQYVIGLINNADGVYGVETIIQNNDPMILITLGANSTGPHPVYHPTEDTWWMLSNAGDLSPLNTDVPAFLNRIACVHLPLYGAQWLMRDSAASGQLQTARPDVPGTISITSNIYSEVIDLGINRWKHLARIDAIGDYGNNTLTLAYNGTPDYSQTYTNCSPTKTPSSIGYGSNISWYNLGRYRRFSFKLSMAGIGPGYHEAYDVEYNIGVS